ncbi:uncharacterized protein LOC106642533 [Copidosoma floridanum]|uniref:uncharacterized protein LOC106642533 n=1 Tax=Copidosoma floridanum TaxID=29053 RepID=UPI0006C9B29C|nr:uncharacterized protein LOC106642533 [Copidosoma floridanum]
MRVVVGIISSLACCCCLALASPTRESNAEKFEGKLVSLVDELNQKETIGLYGNVVTLERSAVPRGGEVDQSEVDPLVRRIDEFLRSRRLQIRFPSDGSSADYFGRALGQKDVNFELRGLVHGASEARTKIKRILLPVLLALKLKAIIVLPIIITMIGLIGIKGLGAGVLALLLSGAVALKALLTPPVSYSAPARVSFAKPYEIHHDHWHRSQEEQLVNQPYRAWSPEFSIDPQFVPYQDIP